MIGSPDDTESESSLGPEEATRALARHLGEARADLSLPAALEESVYACLVAPQRWSELLPIVRPLAQAQPDLVVQGTPSLLQAAAYLGSEMLYDTLILAARPDIRNMHSTKLALQHEFFEAYQRWVRSVRSQDLGAAPLAFQLALHMDLEAAGRRTVLNQSPPPQSPAALIRNWETEAGSPLSTQMCPSETASGISSPHASQALSPAFSMATGASPLTTPAGSHGTAFPVA